MKGRPNDLGNQTMLHKGSGFSSAGHDQSKVNFGLNSDEAGQSVQKDLVSMRSVMRNLRDLSPFGMRVNKVYTPIALQGGLAGLNVGYPHVMYSPDGFGSELEDPKTRARLHKRWRMYVQDFVNFNIWFTESDDGYNWDLPQMLDPLVFLPAPSHPLQGLKVFYDETGLITIDTGAGPVDYKYAAIFRQTDLVVGDATDMWIAYSNDGITWLKTQCGNHLITGNPFGNELPLSFGVNAVGMYKSHSDLVFSPAAPRSFFNAPGWAAHFAYRTEPGFPLLGDTEFGTSIMGQNSVSPLEAMNIGDHPTFRRTVIRDVGPRSFGHWVRANIVHVVRYQDVFFALVQGSWAIAGTGNFNPSAIGLAISFDGLTFEHIGLLQDAGYIYRFNQRSGVVDNTNMDPTTYLYSLGLSTGSDIIAGSIVVDPNGMGFGRDQGSQPADFMRIYWAEGNPFQLCVGSL